MAQKWIDVQQLLKQRPNKLVSCPCFIDRRNRSEKGNFWFWMVADVDAATVNTAQGSYLYHRSKAEGSGLSRLSMQSHTRHPHGPRTAAEREGRACRTAYLSSVSINGTGQAQKKTMSKSPTTTLNSHAFFPRISSSLMHICHYALAFQALFFNVRFWRGKKEWCRIALDRV